MTQIIDQEIKEHSHKVYSDTAVAAGAFIGGPLVSCFFMTQTATTLRKPEKNLGLWTATIIFSGLIVFLVAYVPAVEKIPGYVIPVTYTIAYYQLHKNWYGKDIQAHIENGGQLHGWARVILLSILGLIIYMLIIIGFLVANDPINQMSNIRTFGNVQHEIHYTNNVTDDEADDIGNALMTNGLFGNNEKSYIYTDKKNQVFLLYVVLDELSIYNPEIIQYYKELEEDVESTTDYSASILLCVESLDDVRETIE